MESAHKSFHFLDDYQILYHFRALVYRVFRFDDFSDAPPFQGLIMVMMVFLKRNEKSVMPSMCLMKCVNDNGLHDGLCGNIPLKKGEPLNM